MSAPRPRHYLAVILFFLIANAAPYILRSWVLSRLDIQVTALLDEDGRPLNKVERRTIGVAEELARKVTDYLELEQRETGQKKLLVEVSAENKSGIQFSMIQAEYVLEIGKRKVASGKTRPKEPLDMPSSEKTAIFLPLEFLLSPQEVRSLAVDHPEVYIKGTVYLGKGRHSIESPFSMAFALRDLDF